jgi:hypothetical protein
VAGKTNTERIQEIGEKVIQLTVSQDNLAETLRREMDRLQTDQRDILDSLNNLVSRLAVLDQRCTQLEKVSEESERRRWQVWLALLGCLFTLIISLVLLFLKGNS